MRVVAIVLSSIYGLSLTLASQVCSPEQCIKGSSSSRILSTDHGSKKQLLPGTYHSSSDIDTTSLDPVAELNETIVLSGNTLIILPPPRPVLFASQNYKGSISTASQDWKSVYLPEGWYGVVQPGKALWGAVPDMGQLPSLPSTRFSSIALGTCDPPCASGGTCVSSPSSGPVCQCQPGWIGASCDTCEKGHYGSACKACPEDCSACDDGLSGSGQCIGVSPTPQKTCNCAHGTCTAFGDCVCAAGYTTNTTATDTKCSTCLPGFFLDSGENCLACPLGCATCQLREGTNATATCTSCTSSLSLSTADPATCVTTGSCSSGQYFDQATSTCRGCSPACSTCTGPSTSDCLACTTPRVNLQGTCVGFDAMNGVCDTTLTPLQGTFVVDNEKNKCEACPAGCGSCTLPGFSSGTTYSAASCQGCQDGYLLQDSRCVRTCSEGWFKSAGDGRNGTCQRCDLTCVDCMGTATSCTKCAAPASAANGQCLSDCPANTFASNGTCLSCSPDCATCSSSSASACLSCPFFRPILSNGRCLDHCPSDQYFELSSNSCKACDTSCKSCVGPGSAECSACQNGQVLRKGTCERVDCAFAPGLGICLDSLLDKTNRNWLAFIVLPFVLAGLGFGFWWYVRRERRRTHEATRDFADAMDDRDVRDRMMILRLEKVLGLDRIRPTPNVPRETPASKVKERKRLRELLLLSRKREKKAAPEQDTDIPLKERPVERESHWFQPPPPYSSSTAASSSDSIATANLPAMAASKDINRVKITSMSSPVSPLFEPTALKPPRRSHKVPLGAGETDGKEVDRKSSLRRLWPDMPISPGFGGSKEVEDREGRGRRVEHGWV